MAWFALTATLVLLATFALLARKAVVAKKTRRSQFDDKWMGWTALAVVAFLTLVPFGSAGFFGGHQYAEGTYTGYPVSVGEGGIIWHTVGLSMKTDRESSNFEGFCIVDEDITEQVLQAADDNARIKVHYTRHFWWVDGCQLENVDVIRSVEILPGGGASDE